MKNIKIRDYINLLEKIEKEYGNIEVVENEYFETKEGFNDTFVQPMIPTVAKNEKNENIVVIASHDVGQDRIGQKQNKKEIEQKKGKTKNKIFVDKIKQV